MEPAKPELVAVDAQGQVLLRGGQCECGYRFFPMQTYGCERCGRDAAGLERLLLAGTGELVSSAEVKVHRGDDPPPPFTIGAVRLDQGPTVRARLSASGYAIGSRMRACLVPAQADPSRGELRFALVED